MTSSNLTSRLQKARIVELEAEVARLKQALGLCPDGVERGYVRREALRLLPLRPSVASRAMRRR